MTSMAKHGMNAVNVLIQLLCAQWMLTDIIIGL